MATSQPTPQQLKMANDGARSLITTYCPKMKQQIFANTIATPSNGNVINISPRNVGLLLGFQVQIKATVTNDAGSTATLTDFGAANILSNIQFVDLANNVRVQTTGWHLNLVNSAKKGMPWASARIPNAYPVGYGNNFTDVTSSPASLVASAAGTLNMSYYVPLAYSDFDLRGSVFANVTNANTNLQLTINPAAFKATGDATLSIYSGNTGVLSNVEIVVYQIYYDQIPTDPQTSQFILPRQDLSTMYKIESTSMNSMVPGQDFGIPYANYREFLSTFMVYDNNGTLNVGTDINYWGLQAANTTFFWNVRPRQLAIDARHAIGCDFPKGTYYVDSRLKPINTNQWGNTQLILNTITAPAGTVCLIGYESFGILNQLMGAQSLPSGG